LAKDKAWAGSPDNVFRGGSRGKEQQFLQEGEPVKLVRWKEVGKDLSTKRGKIGKYDRTLTERKKTEKFLGAKRTCKM